MFKRIISLKESVEERLFSLFQTKIEIKKNERIKSMIFNGIGLSIFSYFLSPLFSMKIFDPTVPKSSLVIIVLLTIIFANIMSIIISFKEFIKYKVILSKVKNFTDVYNNDYESLIDLNLSLTDSESKKLLSDNLNTLQTNYLFKNFICKDYTLEYYDLKELESLNISSEEISNFADKKFDKKSKKLLKKKNLHLKRLDNLFDEQKTNPNFDNLVNMIELEQKIQEQKLNDENYQLKFTEKEFNLNNSNIKTLL